MQTPLHNLRIFVSYSWYAYRALFSWLTPGAYLTLKILGPITEVLFFTLLGQASGGDPAYYIIGNATHMAVTSGIFGLLQVISTERAMGTLPHLIITPTNNAVTFYGRSLFLIVDGLTSIAAGFGVGALVFGLSFAQINWPLLICALLAICFAVSGLGLVLGTLGLLGTDLNVLLNLTLAGLLMLCGSNFPVSELPVPLQIFSACLPITHGLAAVRAIFVGTTSGVGAEILIELGIGVMYMLAGYLLFVYAERRARSAGTLELV